MNRNSLDVRLNYFGLRDIDEEYTIVVTRINVGTINTFRESETTAEGAVTVFTACVVLFFFFLAILYFRTNGQHILVNFNLEVILGLAGSSQFQFECTIRFLHILSWQSASEVGLQETILVCEEVVK